MVDEGVFQPPERKWKIPLLVFFKDASLVFKMDELGSEILCIAFPAALALAADPIASLIDTAFIGHLGPVALAAVGVSIAIFNQASRIAVFPLVSITTSLVAEEDTIERISNEVPKGENSEKVSDKNCETKELKDADAMLEILEEGSTKDSEMKASMPEDDSKTSAAPCVSTGGRNKAKSKREKRHIPSASTALVIGGLLGLIQTLFLIFAAKPLLSFMGVKSGSPMLPPALKYLTLRSLGAPAVLLSLAMQGVFRGFKDTKTPLYATANSANLLYFICNFWSTIVAGDLTNIILDPIFIFVCRLGISGAAIAHVISQYLISLILLLKLMTRVNLLPPRLKDLQFHRFLKNGFLLLWRVIAVTFCVTLAASLAARLGSIPMAAFQICLQVWLTSSLLADGLAVAGQAILACAFAEKDYGKATAAATRVLQMTFVLGLGLALLVGVGLKFGAGVFTRDPNVLQLISISIPVMSTKTTFKLYLESFDDKLFLVGDPQILVSILSIASLFYLSKTNGFVGIWVALTIYMVLRILAGIWR
ncbi:Protein detoxification 43 [Vitis vinifera]|uniref:Protein DETOXIFICATION n=1 Tax=Vitis vinifera TaxID=29760 RepID=A0A438J1L1_VITVI|nr:Protein detoxification 43 [Vitis vinifera]